MSMLTPAQLTVFLAGIGYIMTNAERTRFMRLDRQIFKDTTVLEKLMKEGYSITLVSTRLHRLRDLIRHRGGSYCPLSATTVEYKEECIRSEQTYGYSEWFGGAKYQISDHIEVANVWLIITHKDHLAKDHKGRSVIRHPDFSCVTNSEGIPRSADLQYPRGFIYKDISEECATIFDIYNWTRGRGKERLFRGHEIENIGSLSNFAQDWDDNNPNTIFYMKLNEESPVIHEIKNKYDESIPRYGIADPDDNFYATVEHCPDEGGPTMFSKIPLMAESRFQNVNDIFQYITPLRVILLDLTL